MNSKIVFCGCSSAGLEVLDFLISKNFEISHIVSLNSQQATQYKVLGYASFDEIARKNNIPIYLLRIVENYELYMSFFYCSLHN